MWHDVNRFLPYMIQPGHIGFEEIDASDFMRLIFPDGSLEAEGERTGKYNSFLRVINRGSHKGTSTKTLFIHDGLEEVPCVFDKECDYFVSGVAYSGKRTTLKNASEIYAIDIDIDHLLFEDRRDIVEPTGLIRLGSEFGRSIPIPTAVVASGNGLHVWYVFDRAVHLYPGIKEKMKAAKDYLTTQCWRFASEPSKKPDYLSIVQLSRLPDSPTKRGTPCIGYTYNGGRKLSIYDLNSYLPADIRIDDFGTAKITLAEAKELYPDWYARKFEKPKKRRIESTNGSLRNIYDAWIKKWDLIENGHRYFFLWVACVYGRGYGVPRSEAERDLKLLAEAFTTRTPDDPIKRKDIENALRVYDQPEKSRISNRRVKELCGIAFDCRKTDKHLPQKDHLNSARQSLATKRHNDPEAYGSKREAVARWRLSHPMGTPKECEKETGICKTTVYKWWDKCLEGEIRYEFNTESTSRI